MKKLLTLSMLCVMCEMFADDTIFTEITSKHLEISLLNEQTHLIFLNDVKVESADFSLRSEKIEVFFAGKEEMPSEEELRDKTREKKDNNQTKIKKIVASERARFVQKYRCGEADTIILDLEKQQIEMFGNARIKEDSGVICGPYLAIDNASRILRAGHNNSSTQDNTSSPPKNIISNENLKNNTITDVEKTTDKEMKNE